ncbi:MAG TPA: sugar kinase [Terriglobia bacterium]|nr:sugar kinase [Terriglobia bacterium]
MAEIVTFGELLVEFVATQTGQTFDSPGTFEGPFASGAPAIFADQAARQGASVAIAGCVGQDAFGEAILRRLADDGVSITGVVRSADRPTGSAFVAYRADGERQFVFNIAQSAAGLLDEAAIHPALFQDCRWLHIMGSSLYNTGAIRAARSATGEAQRHGCKISFDPNIRPELAGPPDVQQALRETLEVCDLFLPSEADLRFFHPDLASDDLIRKLLERPSLEAVVLKRGAAGSLYVSRDQRIEARAFGVTEVDPTGAGDCFCGTFLASLVGGLAVRQALVRANAAGAMAVLRRGPMEGNSSKEQLDRFIAARFASLSPGLATD